MRRAITALVAGALGLLLLAGTALAFPDTTSPTVELTVTPTDPKAGDAVLIEAYVHFGPKPYQGAQVEFLITGPGMAKAMSLHGKPGQAGYFRNQFTAQSAGDHQIVTLVDGKQVVPKPYHLQVGGASGASSAAWLPLAAGGGALALLILAGAAIASRTRIARTIPALPAKS